MNARDALDRLRRYALDRRGAARALRALAARRTVAESRFFDREWYLREHPELVRAGVDPALHYLLAGHPAGLDPGPDFCGAEYLALNPDAAASGANPLVHWERAGRRRGARISFLQPVGPDGRADPGWRFPTPAEHQAAFPAKVAAVRAKAARGERVRAVFFAASAAMFPARPLLDAMRRDPAFDARIAVIPDLRGIAGGDPEPAMERCRAALAADYPEEAFLRVSRGGPGGGWNDVLAEFGADVVCHPSPYDLGDFRHNPRWCVGRPYLPVHVNYGYYRSVYDRAVMSSRNYALFWKAFFECPENLAEYAACSALRGANGEVSGYVKMDALAAFPRRGGARKSVLVCPHHSVEGGANDSLALSNFLRMADFFAGLPAEFPELDFVFRPHPFLFPVLSRPKFWGKAKCEAWKARFLSHANASWSEGGPYFAEFAAADAMVQDCGSYLMEWFYTGKPCCYILKSEADRAKFSPLGREALDHCSVAFGPRDVSAFLRGVAAGAADPSAPAREAFRARIAVNWPHAADAALASVKRAIGIA